MLKPETNEVKTQESAPTEQRDAHKVLRDFLEKENLIITPFIEPAKRVEDGSLILKPNIIVGFKARK